MPLTGDNSVHHLRQCQGERGAVGSLYHLLPLVAWSSCAAGRASWTDRRGLRGAWRRPT